MKESPPKRVGKYPIIREIGKGSTSRVYLGRDPFAEREFAVKVFSAKIRGRRRRKKNAFARFLRTKRRSCASCTIRTSRRSKTRPPKANQNNIVIEYVAGGTLADYCNGRYACSGREGDLDHIKCTRASIALTNGLIHRDIKPANILISHDTEIKSPTSVAVQEDRTNTTHTRRRRLPRVYAPEQIKEQTLQSPDRHLSLGVVMYQMLTGRLPFVAKHNAGLTYMILNEEPEPRARYVRRFRSRSSASC